MKFIFAVLLFTSSSLCYAQTKISAATSEIVKQISRHGQFESEFVGFAAQPSNQFRLMRQLALVAHAEELFLLTKSESPIVRIYSFIALVQKNQTLARKAYLHLRQDTTKVFTQYGCIGGKESVAYIISPYFRGRE
ncbi:MAG TPA: hypothetical protein PL009_05695 [Flavipsychrobacter sp.]|nr:hypothetical protein [Flavipsychrobacter sp.]